MPYFSRTCAAGNQPFSVVVVLDGDAGGCDIVNDGREPTKSTGALSSGLEPSELEDEDSMPNPTVLFSVIAALTAAGFSKRPPEGTRECGTLGCTLGLRLYDESKSISTSSSLSLFSLEAVSS